MEESVDTKETGENQEVTGLFCIFSFGGGGRRRGLHPRHMEVPRRGAESELQLLASTTAHATPDP